MKLLDANAFLGPLVQAALKHHPAFSVNPLGDWAELVGEQVARYSLPKSLKKKLLVIVAYDSVWKHHLELNKDGLIEKINKGRPETLVEQIVIKIGEVPEAHPSLNPAASQLEKAGKKRYRPKKLIKNPTRDLTPEDKALLQSLHPDLRKRAARLLKRLPPDQSA